MTNVEGAVSGSCPLLLTEWDVTLVRGWTGPDAWLGKPRRAVTSPCPGGSARRPVGLKTSPKTDAYPLWPRGAGSGPEPREGPLTQQPHPPCGHQLLALYVVDLGVRSDWGGEGDERGLPCVLNHQSYSL